MSLSDFKIISKLGEGAYSSVYRVKRISDSNIYALKKVKLMNLSEKEKQNALNEVRILASIRNPNIVMYREVFLEERTNSLCIIMEYCDNGDLYQKIVKHQKKRKLFKESEIWSILIQTVKGLKVLHDRKVFHRDLKSANVFLNKDGTAKLGDLNVSKIAKRGLLYTQTGTPYYASPEVWKDKPYDSKSDVWSLGCVLYEMTTLKPPFHAKDMEGLFKKVTRGYYNKIPTHFSQDLMQVIKSLLQVSPSQRPSCEKILNFPGVVKRMEENIMNEVDETNPDFMKTIIIPKNLHYLTERLPQPNYEPLKLKKIDKHSFLQTLGGYKDPDTQKYDKSLVQKPKQDEYKRVVKDKRKKDEKQSKQKRKLPQVQQQRKRQSNIYNSVDSHNRNAQEKKLPRHAIEYSKRRNPQQDYDRRRHQRDAQRRRNQQKSLQQKMLDKYSTRGSHNKKQIHKGYAYKIPSQRSIQQQKLKKIQHKKQNENLNNSPYLQGRSIKIHKNSSGPNYSKNKNSNGRQLPSLNYGKYGPNQDMIKKSKIKNIMNAYNAKPDSIEQLREKYAKIRKSQDKRKQLNHVKYHRSKKKSSSKNNMDILDIYKNPHGKPKLEPLKKIENIK